MNAFDLPTTAVVIAMVGVTVLTRSFFFLSTRPWELPPWAQRGLDYAPVAALAAVIGPEVLLTHGHLTLDALDARWFGAAAGAGYYLLRRGVLGTIVVGMAVYLPLHVGLGW